MKFEQCSKLYLVSGARLNAGNPELEESYEGIWITSNRTCASGRRTALSLEGVIYVHVARAANSVALHVLEI